MAVTLIDLDEPVRHRPGKAPVLRMIRTAAARRRRGVLAAVVAVAAMLGLATSASASVIPAPRLYAVGPAATQSRYAVEGDHLFTVGSDNRSVSAYSMISGEAVWRLAAENVVYLRALAGVDRRTGAVRMDLANWSPIGAYAGRQLVQWIPGSTYDPGWLGLLDPTAPGGVRALFPLGQVFRCSVAQGWLFCEIMNCSGQAGALRLDGDLIS
jgi:hypothetical protein